MGTTKQNFQPNDLIPTTTIIQLARSSQVDFGSVDPNERIRYFIKLGLLPNAKRLTDPAKRKDPIKPPQTIGHLPFWTLERLIEIDKLHKKGLTYLQIKDKLSKKPASKIAPEKEHLPSFDDPGKLLPTKTIIEIALAHSVDFGSGDPAERIRYFIKLGLLPNVKKLASKNLLDNKNRPVPVGHLPAFCAERLVKIDRLHKSGIAYGKIEDELETLDSLEKELPAKDKVLAGKLAGFALWPRLGFSTKELEKRLAVHEGKIKALVEQSQTGIGAWWPQEKPQNPLYFAARVLTITLVSGGLGLGIIYTTARLVTKEQEGKKLAVDTTQSLKSLGEVLAASSEKHKFYIDADTEVSGTTLFLEDITAPNIVYEVTGGTGIEVSGGQRPVVSLAEDAIVTSVNDLTGDVDVKGSGGTTISTSGSTITISSTTGLTSEADTLATVTGRGATTSTLVNLDGGIAVDTSNFTVSGTAGDILTAGDLAINGGDLTTTAATFNLVNAATTLNIGSTNIARAINIGIGTDVDTISIGTGATGADVVTIGQAAADVSLTDANWSITGAGLIR